MSPKICVILRKKNLNGEFINILSVISTRIYILINSKFIALLFKNIKCNENNIHKAKKYETHDVGRWKKIRYKEDQQQQCCMNKKEIRIGKWKDSENSFENEERKSIRRLLLCNIYTYFFIHRKCDLQT